MNTLGRPAAQQSTVFLQLLVLGNRYFRGKSEPDQSGRKYAYMNRVSGVMQRAMGKFPPSAVMAMIDQSLRTKLTPHGVNCATRVADDILTRGCVSAETVASIRSRPVVFE